MSSRNLYPFKVSTDVFLRELGNLVELLHRNLRIERILIIVDDLYRVRLGGRPLQFDLCDIVTPPEVTPELLARYHPNRTHVLYGVECNSDGLPAIAQIVRAGFKFSPFGGAPVGSYVYDNATALQTLERQYLQQHLAGYAKFEDPGSSEDFANLCQALETTRHVPGAVVEFGCFRGSSTSVMLDYALSAGLDREFHIFDIFDGFTYEEARKSPDAMWQGTHKTEGYDIVRQRLEAIGYPKLKVYKANVITAPLPPEITQIAIANVDVDLYEAVRAGLEKVADLIPPGGIIICEDAGHTPNLIGARLALQEFMQSPRGRRFTQILLASGQAFLVAHAPVAPSNPA